MKYPALLANRMRGPGNNGGFSRMGLWSRSHKLPLEKYSLYDQTVKSFRFYMVLMQQRKPTAAQVRVSTMGFIV